MSRSSNTRSVSSRGQENDRPANSRRRSDRDDSAEPEGEHDNPPQSIFTMPSHSSRPTSMNIPNNFLQYQKRNPKVQEVLDNAVAEARSDFRPHASMSKKPEAAKGNRSTNAAQGSSSDSKDTYAIKAVVFIAEGLGSYKKVTPPDLSTCIELATKGLAVVAEEKGDLVINKKWNTKETLAYFRSKLPLPFDYMQLQIDGGASHSLGKAEGQRSKRPPPLCHFLGKAYRKFNTDSATMSGAEVVGKFIAAKSKWEEHFVSITGPFPIDADIIAEWEVSEPDEDIAMAGPESDEHPHRDEDATTLTESAPATGSIATLRPKATAGLKRSRVIESSSESESDVVAPVRAPILKKRRIQKGKANDSPSVKPSAVEASNPAAIAGSSGSSGTTISAHLVAPSDSDIEVISNPNPTTTTVTAQSSTSSRSRPHPAPKAVHARIDLSPTVARTLTKFNPYI